MNALTELRILMDREPDGSRDLEILQDVHERMMAGTKVPHDLVMQCQRIINKGNTQNRYGK